jgi:HAE1 family hydrophobic/amphiphilic exporter-1
MPDGMGLDYSGLSFQEQQAQKSVPAWVVYALSHSALLPHPGGAV